MSSAVVYFIETAAKRQRHLLCQVVEFFCEAKMKTQVVADSAFAAQNLDQLLWVFSEDSFIPHRILAPEASDSIVEPVVITVGKIFVEGFDNLVCDCPMSLDFMQRYRLSVHFVLQDDVDRKQESRLLWSACADQGVDRRHVIHETDTKWSDIFKST